MRVAVAATKWCVGLEPPGTPKTIAGVADEYTFDWRQRPGSPDNTARVRPVFQPRSLDEALHRTYRTDAHLVTYVVIDRDGRPLDEQPRVNKGGLPWLLEQGYAVEHDLLMCDVDNPLHAEWDDRQHARFDSMWAKVPALRTCGVYFTRHGYRLIQPLDEPVGATEVERYLASWLEELTDQGVEPDRACIDWTRLFRLPHVKRGAVAYRSPFVDLSRLRPRVITPKRSAGLAGRLAVGDLAA